MFYLPLGPHKSVGIPSKVYDIKSMPSNLIQIASLVSFLDMKFTLGSLSLWFLCLIQWTSAATVFFPVTLTWGNRTVAGVSRPVISTNGQFPGPPLRINQGDSVEFLVDNRCPFNTTIHFHGMSWITRSALG